MKRIQASEILSLTDYDQKRDSMRTQIFKIKDERRVQIKPHLTFLFENHDTILYQIQEMLRAEKQEGKQEIAHEIETYNELIGERGELGCTLMIEIEDPAERAVKLTQWLDLLPHIYLKTARGSKIAPQYDPRQVGESRISSVHYLRFKIGDQIPQAVGCSHALLSSEMSLTPIQAAALCKDLVS
jgi:hypothetical protein